jgi:hypothetical protein
LAEVKPQGGAEDRLGTPQGGNERSGRRSAGNRNTTSWPESDRILAVALPLCRYRSRDRGADNSTPSSVLDATNHFYLQGGVVQGTGGPGHLRRCYSRANPRHVQMGQGWGKGWGQVLFRHCPCLVCDGAVFSGDHILNVLKGSLDSCGCHENTWDICSTC